MTVARPCLLPFSDLFLSDHHPPPQPVATTHRPPPPCVCHQRTVPLDGPFVWRSTEIVFSDLITLQSLPLPLPPYPRLNPPGRPGWTKLSRILRSEERLIAGGDREFAAAHCFWRSNQAPRFADAATRGCCFENDPPAPEMARSCGVTGNLGENCLRHRASRFVEIAVLCFHLVPSPPSPSDARPGPGDGSPETRSLIKLPPMAFFRVASARDVGEINYANRNRTAAAAAFLYATRNPASAGRRARANLKGPLKLTFSGN